jgi:hypothetical protein
VHLALLRSLNLEHWLLLLLKSWNLGDLVVSFNEPNQNCQIKH